MKAPAHFHFQLYSWLAIQALPSSTSSTAFPPGTLNQNFLPLFPVALYNIEVLSASGKVKEMKNTNSTYLFIGSIANVTKGKESIPLVALVKLKWGNFK